MRRHAGTAYLSMVAVGGFSVAAAAVVLVPSLPAAAPPIPTVSITTAPASPGPSSPSAGVAPVHGAPTPKVILVAGSSGGVSSGPTGLPAPSSSASGSVSPTPSSPTPSPSSSVSGRPVVRLVVHADVSPTPTIGASLGVLGAAVVTVVVQ